MALLVRDTRIICAAFHIETEQESDLLLGVGMAACDAVDGSSTRHVSALDVGAVKAPTIRRSYPCKRSRQSVSTLPNRSFRRMALILLARWSSVAS